MDENSGLLIKTYHTDKNTLKIRYILIFNSIRILGKRTLKFTSVQTLSGALVKSEWSIHSIVYIEGSQVIFSKTKNVFFSDDGFYVTWGSDLQHH